MIVKHHASNIYILVQDSFFCKEAIANVVYIMQTFSTFIFAEQINVKGIQELINGWIIFKMFGRDGKFILTKLDINPSALSV